jgi:hypothetical protein
MSKNDPAFPVTKTELFYDRDAGQYYPHVGSEGGLTMREWFAGMAMQAYVSSDSWRKDADQEYTARCAVYMADELIAELERTCTNTAK